MIHEEMTVAAMKENGLGNPGTGEPWFTGWKEYGGALGPKGYIGQLVQWVPKVRRVAFVNLPGMESGLIPIGSCFDVGSERLSETMTAEEMRELLVRGLEKLKELVNSAGEADAKGVAVRDI